MVFIPSTRFPTLTSCSALQAISSTNRCLLLRCCCLISTKFAIPMQHLLLWRHVCTWQRIPFVFLLSFLPIFCICSLHLLCFLAVFRSFLMKSILYFFQSLFSSRSVCSTLCALSFVFVSSFKLMISSLLEFKQQFQPLWKKHTTTYSQTDASQIWVLQRIVNAFHQSQQ